MKKQEEGNERRTLMDDVIVEEINCTQIEYCPDHYGELQKALLDRNLHDYISGSAEEMVSKLERGKSDAGLEASSAITTSAMQLFGPESVMNIGGCPVCAFHNIIDHVADHMAVKFKRSN